MKRIYIVNTLPIVRLAQGRVEWVTEVDPGFLRDLWQRFLEQVKQLALSVKGLKLSGVDAVRLLNDLIVIYLKKLLLTPIVPPALTQPSGVPLHPIDLLFVWRILDDLRQAGDRDIEVLLEVFNRTYLEDLSISEHPGSHTLHRLRDITLSRLGRQAYQLLFDPYGALEEDPDDTGLNLEKAYRLSLIRCVPADTRPGLSSSSLLVHALLTSAIAAALAEVRGIGKDDIELLRCAALIHDFAKPLAWWQSLSTGTYVSHTSEEIVDNVLRELELHSVLDSQLLERLRALIIYHHRPEEIMERVRDEKLVQLARTLRDADQLASEQDRVVELIEMRLDELARQANLEAERLRDGLRYTGAPQWSWWLREVSDEAARRLAEAIAERVFSEDVLAKQPLVGEAQQWRDVSALVVDIASIQRYIQREDLRSLVGASAFVDYVTLYAVPKAVMIAYSVPPEAIVYAGGGVVMAIVPSKDRIDEVRNQIRRISRLAISFRAALASFQGTWRDTVSELFRELGVQKLSAAVGESRFDELPLLGVEVVCECCGSRPATSYLGDARAYYCEECAKLRSFGDGLYIGYKLSVLRGSGYDSELEDEERLKRFFLQWLSGHDRWDVGEYSNVAALKLDGNAMGLLMYNSLNVTDMALKSILIDYGLKRGIYRALKNLLNNIGEPRRARQRVAQVFAGILYAGGDDMLAVVPADVAPAVATSISIEFWRTLGVRQLSVGIGSAKPKQNIWNIFDTANELLSRCKKALRDRCGRLSDLWRYVSVMALVHSDQQLLPAHVEWTLDRYGPRGKKLSCQPLFIEVDGSLKPVEAINALPTLVSPLMDSIGGLLELPERLARVSPGDASSIVELLREVYAVAQKSASDPSLMNETMAIYILRESKSNKVAERMVHLLKVALSHSGPLQLPIFDFYTLCRIIGGGER